MRHSFGVDHTGSVKVEMKMRSPRDSGLVETVMGPGVFVTGAPSGLTLECFETPMILASTFSIDGFCMMDQFIFHQHIV